MANHKLLLPTDKIDLNQGGGLDICSRVRSLSESGLHFVAV